MHDTLYERPLKKYTMTISASDYIGKALMQCTYLDKAAIYEKIQILTRYSVVVKICHDKKDEKF